VADALSGVAVRSPPTALAGTAAVGAAMIAFAV